MALSMFVGVLLVAMSFCAVVARNPEEDGDGSEGNHRPPSKDRNENAKVNKVVLNAIEKFKTEAEDLEGQSGQKGVYLSYSIHAPTGEDITVTLHSGRVKQLSHFNERITSTTLELTFTNLEIIGGYTMTKTEKKITGMFTMTPKEVVVNFEISMNRETGRINLNFKGLSVKQAHTDFKEHFKHIMKVVANNWHIHLTEPTFLNDVNSASESFLSEYFKKQIRARLNKLLRKQWQKTRQANL